MAELIHRPTARIVSDISEWSDRDVLCVGRSYNEQANGGFSGVNAEHKAV
jgi:hypothetical protein